MKFILAADIGTTALKAVLYSREGTAAACCTREYSFESPLPGRAELSAQVYTETFAEAVRELPLPRAPFRHLREKMRDKRLDEGAFHQASSQSAISPAAFRSSGFSRMEPGTLASPATCALHCRNPAVAKLFRFVSTIPL